MPGPSGISSDNTIAVGSTQTHPSQREQSEVLLSAVLVEEESTREEQQSQQQQQQQSQVQYAEATTVSPLKNRILLILGCAVVVIVVVVVVVVGTTGGGGGTDSVNSWVIDGSNNFGDAAVTGETISLGPNTFSLEGSGEDFLHFSNKISFRRALKHFFRYLQDDVPSFSPSFSPTSAPITLYPSRRPTQSPVTPSPSRRPTLSPVTPQPSRQPTPSPEQIVTEPPSPVPSAVPSAEPSGGTPQPTDDPGSEQPDKPDAFYFSYQLMEKTFSLESRVCEETWNTGDQGRAGIMIRDTLDPLSSNIFMAFKPGIGGTFTYRSSPNKPSTANAGDSTTTQATSSSSCLWIRIDRVSTDTYIPYWAMGREEDQNAQYVEWQTWLSSPVTVSIAMEDPLYIGMAMVSGDTDVTNTVIFDSLQVE